jgi:hypothetical protein
VFLEQPGHGVIVVEKWLPGAEPGRPFDLIHSALTNGRLQMSYDIAQGPVQWAADSSNSHLLMRRARTQFEIALPAAA